MVILMKGSDNCEKQTEEDPKSTTYKLQIL